MVLGLDGDQLLQVVLALVPSLLFIFWELWGRDFRDRRSLAHPLYIELRRNYRLLRAWLRDLSEGGPIVGGYVDLEDFRYFQGSFRASQHRISAFRRPVPARLVQVYADLQRLPALQRGLTRLPRSAETEAATRVAEQRYQTALQELKNAVGGASRRAECLLPDLHRWAKMKGNVEDVFVESTDSSVWEREQQLKIERRWWNRLPPQETVV